MRLITILLTVFAIFELNVLGQLTQEQCQQADTQLNQVYRQLMGSLNDAQKQQLKLAQRDWIKKRDSFVAANPGNPQGALYQATIQRIGELTRFIRTNVQSQETQQGFSQSATSGINTRSDQQWSNADEQLNQVYQQLRGSLNETQRQQLKLAQLEWLQKRNAFVAAHPENPQGAFNQITNQRISELKSVNTQSSQIVDNNKSNTLSDLCNKLSINGIKESRIRALFNFDSLIRNNGGTNANAILNAVKQLNNAKQIIIPKKDINYDEGIMPVKIKSSVDAIINNLGNTWPRELNHNWISLWNYPKVVLQHKNSEELVSEACSQNLVARSFKENPSIYIFDKKNNIELLQINTDDFYNWNRDMGLSPRNLMFSQDGKYLVFGKKTSGYQTPNIYLVNTSSWEILKVPFPAYPLFVKDSNNKTVLELCDTATLGTNNSSYYDQIGLSSSNTLFSYQEGLTSQSQEEMVKQIKSRFIDEGNKIVIKEDQAVIPNQINSYIQPLEKENGTQYSISWSNLFQDKNLFLDLISLKSEFGQNQSTSSLILNKVEATAICDKRPMPCFWGFLSDLNHDCQDDRCRKDVSVSSVLTTQNGRWEIPQYIFDRGQQPSGWQTTSCIGVFDTLAKKWLALPALRVMWSTVPISDGSKWVSMHASSVTTNSSGVVTLHMSAQTKRFPHKLSGEKNELPEYLPLCLPPMLGKPNDLARHIYFDSSTNILWISCLYEGLQCLNLNKGSLEKVIYGVTPFQSFSVKDNIIVGIPELKEGKLEIWNLSTPSKIADVFVSDDGSSIFSTPEGFYSSNSRNKKVVAFRSGNHGFPLEQFDLRLNRPDIVLDRLGAPKEAIEAAKTLREKRLKKMNVTEEMLQPDFHLPEVALTTEVPSTTSSDQIDLKIKATDDKYPLERLRVFVNNVPINGTEGESLHDQKTQNLEKTIPIKLAAGRNKIQVSVLNSAGAESLYANAEVNCTADRPKPKLYAVAMGVSQYNRPEWCLKYAAKDATDLIGKLKAKAGSSYSEVKPLLLTDKDVTKESAAKIKEFLSGATIDDTVLIFMAGHGILDDKYDYYFGTTDINPAKPAERGMPYEAIDTILAEVPSLKKALLMDTCHAGELDADEKKQLAASDASTQGVPIQSGSKVAMRAIGTRGMQVKAVEGAKGRNDWYERLQDMFVDLRRGSGSTILSSSEGAEYAYESSDQQNGLFTYALMEALDGKGHPADAKSPEVTMSEVAEYVKKRVGDLTNHKQTPNARRVNLEGDFALGTSR